LAYLRFPVEDARLLPAGARVRATAWGGGAVVGRNPGERVKGAVGPLLEDGRRYGKAHRRADLHWVS